MPHLIKPWVNNTLYTPSLVWTIRIVKGSIIRYLSKDITWKILRPGDEWPRSQPNCFQSICTRPYHGSSAWTVQVVREFRFELWNSIYSNEVRLKTYHKKLNQNLLLSMILTEKATLNSHRVPSWIKIAHKMIRIYFVISVIFRFFLITSTSGTLWIPKQSRHFHTAH